MTSKSLKILIVAPSRKMGGIERALSVISNKWAQQGFEVVYVSCIKSNPFYHLDAAIKVVEPNFKRIGGFSNKILFYPKLLKYIRREVREQKPDRILCFGDFFNPVVLLATLGLNIPTYISDRTSADYKFPAHIKYLKNWLYPKASGFIAQTQRAYDAKEKQFGAAFRQTIIPNAIRKIADTNNNKEHIILYVGRFAWEKNPKALIEAFSKLKNTKDWKLVMAGDGPQLEQMKLKASELGMSHKIVFLGAITNVDEWLNKASIYVLPSVLEGFPNALCEAMAASLPVICFDSIAYESIITPNIDGIVIPFEDTDLLATALNDLMNDQEKRILMGEKALAKSKNWEVEKIISKFSEFLKL